jgi:hypothetical protein
VLTDKVIIRILERINYNALIINAKVKKNKKMIAMLSFVDWGIRRSHLGRVW